MPHNGSVFSKNISIKICSVIEAIHWYFEGLAWHYKMERENPANIPALEDLRKLSSDITGYAKVPKFIIGIITVLVNFSSISF